MVKQNEVHFSMKLEKDLNPLSFYTSLSPNQMQIPNKFDEIARENYWMRVNFAFDFVKFRVLLKFSSSS